MSNPDDYVTGYSNLSKESCNIARENREEIKREGASTVIVEEHPGEPNLVSIWGPTQEDVRQAGEFFSELCEEQLR